MTHLSETAATVSSANLAGAPPSMATISALLSSTKPEIQPSSSSPTPPSSESNLIKQQQTNMTNTLTVDLPPPPPFINSIDGLRSLSTALSTFLRRYDELHDHLNFIKTSIDAKLPDHVLNSDNPSQFVTSLIEASVVDNVADVHESMEIDQNPSKIATNCVRNRENVKMSENADNISEKSEEIDTLKKKNGNVVDNVADVHETMEIDQNPRGIATNCGRNHENVKMSENADNISEKSEEIDTLKKPEETGISKKKMKKKKKKTNESKLNSICEHMLVRQMKRYVMKHISDMNKLYKEIPKALKLATDPAKFVLESIGRFFLSCSKSFAEGEKMSVVRLAAVFILECFVMIKNDDIKIAKEEEENAAKAAVDWRKRMIKEGGLAKTDEFDAKGLLFLISGFGIPGDFSNEDIRDLIRNSNVKNISSVLRRSTIFVSRIPDVIHWMVKNNLEIEAKEIADIFALEDNCLKIKDKQHGPSQVGMGANSGVSEESEETDTSKKPEETDNSDVSELESCCEQMCGRGMRTYVVRHISDINKLRKKIPKALKLAKNPAKLVLEGIGRFFLQGSRTFSEGSIVTVVRQASVLILESFVMISSDGIEIEKEEEEYAEKAAVDWRKRMIKEGGLAITDKFDARGLLLLISGFGIPIVFMNEDIWDLIRASNMKNSPALRRSIILIPRIPEVINWMVKNDLEIEAADIAYTFGLEDKCRPQTILTTFLHNKIDNMQHGTDAKKQLKDLRSIRKCLKVHNVDPSKPLADYKINERIRELEIEIKSINENRFLKRKVKETESLRKRTRLSGHETRSQEPKPVDYYAKSPYNQLTPSNGGGMFTGSYGSGLAVGSGSGLAGGGMFTGSYSSGLAVGSGSGLAGGGMLTGSYGSGLAVENGGGMVTGSYGPGHYGGTYPDQMMNGRPYGWHSDSSLVDRYLGQPYSRTGQTYEPQSGLIGLYGRQSVRPSLEAFPGLPGSSGLGSPGFSGRDGSGSDLYGFADAVVEKESYRGSYASVGRTGRSPYL